MDFSLTPDQQLLSDTGRKLLERECPPALVRTHIEDPAFAVEAAQMLIEMIRAKS